MNIIFFGSSHFGLPSLKALLAAGHKVSCVVTQPDRKKGRGLSLSKTVIKEFAESCGIAVYQPEKVNTSESAAFLKALHPDIFVVIAYGQILSRKILEIPVIMPLNVHGSILPFYRGAAPINWALINGERQTGITVIKMTEKMDAGSVLAEKIEKILPEDGFASLENKLSFLAAQLLPEAIKAITDNNYKLTPQDETRATFAPKLKKEDGLINWGRKAVEIHNLIRGLSSWPGAFTYYHGKMLKVLKADNLGAPGHQGTRAPGEITAVTKEGIIVATGDGDLLLKELQIEGKKAMPAKEFIAGHKISPGDAFLAKKS